MEMLSLLTVSYLCLWSDWSCPFMQAGHEVVAETIDKSKMVGLVSLIEASSLFFV